MEDILKPTSVIEGVTEKVPIFPGCGDLLNNTMRMRCMNKLVNQHIAKKFNTDLATNLGLSPGVKRIYVQFKIDKSGRVSDILTRGPHPELEKEAKRVVNLLPKLEPGLQRGKPVIAPYSLPIVFRIAN